MLKKIVFLTALFAFRPVSLLAQEWQGYNPDFSDSSDYFYDDQDQSYSDDERPKAQYKTQDFLEYSYDEVEKGASKIEKAIDARELDEKTSLLNLKKYRPTFVKQGVPVPALDKAISLYQNLINQLSNFDYIAIIDFSVHSKNKRFYLLNLKNGEIKKFVVSHGVGSDPEHTGKVVNFSNTPNSRATSYGAYRTESRYFGKNGLSMILDGLESSNDNARERAIVVHGADYVRDGMVRMGRSHGCPAVPRKDIQTIVDSLEEGALLYAYPGSLR